MLSATEILHSVSFFTAPFVIQVPLAQNTTREKNGYSDKIGTKNQILLLQQKILL